MGNGSSLVRLPVVAWSVDKTRRRRDEARRASSARGGRNSLVPVRACVRAWGEKGMTGERWLRPCARSSTSNPWSWSPPRSLDPCNSCCSAPSFDRRITSQSLQLQPSRLV
jgi:hypothetical protein